VVLAAAATRTKRIRLTSAVTVLSSDDPVRVFQDFATLDLISGGRAEIMAGRGSFIESFPLFGYDLDDYGALLVGSPQEVIDKMLYEHRLFGYDRFLMQMTVGTMPHASVMRSIELFGTIVAPAVRRAVGASDVAAEAASAARNTNL